MGTLSVWGFSCLKDVTFETRPVVAIIGPQGSGKSVLTKLNYFCEDILNEHILAAERGEDLEDFKKYLSKKFAIWFPPAAWGSKRFNVNYTTGDFSVRILRRYKNEKLSEEIAIKFPEWFEEFYRQSWTLYKNVRERSLDDDLIFENDRINFDPFEESYRVRSRIRIRLLNRLGSDFVDNQIFIPAGRAFFTSIGKLVAAIRSFGALDPLTVEFAERFSGLRSRNLVARSPARMRRLGPEFRARDKVYREKFFGGEVVYQTGAEHVRADDGRQIPFSALSSGQQEVLPMWTVIQHLAEMEAWRASAPSNSNAATAVSRKEILYIEEPEAHLFPEAQSDFLNYLFDSLDFSVKARKLILTTHSPYVIGRLSVFLKAGALSRRKKKNNDIHEIVPRSCWIRPENFSAYAMQDGKILNIVDEYGMIDSRYIDSISNDISRDYDRLLDLEMSI